MQPFLSALVVCLLSNLFMVRCAQADEVAEAVQISGIQLRAVQSAYLAFEKYGYDLTRFTLEVVSRGSEIEVIFYPIRTIEEIGTVFGGRFEAGRVVHYFVSASTFEIVRQHYVR